jgi:hypothetical protein
MSRIMEILSAARLIVSPAWINDTLAVLGVGLVAWGCGWIYAPLAPMVVGVILIYLAISGARKRRGRNDS